MSGELIVDLTGLFAQLRLEDVRKFVQYGHWLQSLRLSAMAEVLPVSSRTERLLNSDTCHLTSRQQRAEPVSKGAEM